MEVDSVNNLKDKVVAAKRVLVLGAGVTGQSASMVFSQVGKEVDLFDEREVNKEISESLRTFGVSVLEKACLKDCNFNDYQLAIVSPGIKESSPFYEAILDSQLEIVSELDLYQALLGKPGVSVTGTNGKTTVVNLIHQMLSESGVGSKLLGNVGRTVLSSLIRPLLCVGLAADTQTKDVLEVSSYQLTQIRLVAPRVAVMLNIKPDHLERHGSFESYKASKKKLFENQNSSDFAIINKDDIGLKDFETGLKAQVLYFGMDNLEVPEGAYLSSDFKNLRVKIDSEGIEENFSLENCNLLGQHNLENVAAASISALILGASGEAVQKVINNFKGLPHRVEFVKEKGGGSILMIQNQLIQQAQ